mgnify:CR=1 FL=1
MNNAVWGMLNESEKELLREVEPEKLAKLDEDGLSDLHDRVRRARRKYAKLYRRRASAQVAQDSSRKKAHAQHERTAAKAEAFEEALATVSVALAKAARASAKELKAERIAAARAVRSGAPDRNPGSKGSKVGPADRKKKQKTPISKKNNASNRAKNQRSEVKRASR